MTTKLPEDLRQVLEQEGETPVHLVDALTNERYVIMRADRYECVKALFEDEEFSPAELHRVVEQSFRRAGWDDAEMDLYNDYDAYRPKP
jgi:hypothetical protein